MCSAQKKDIRHNNADNWHQGLTADEGQRIEPLPPLVRDLDDFALVGLLLRIHALVAGVFDDFLHVVMLHGVRHIPKISAVRQSTLSVGSGI